MTFFDQTTGDITVGQKKPYLALPGSRVLWRQFFDLDPALVLTVLPKLVHSAEGRIQDS